MARLGYDALRRPGRRLGHQRHAPRSARQDPDHWPASTSTCRSPRPTRRPSAISPTAEQAALASLENSAEVGHGLLQGAVDPPPDPRLRPRRLARRPVRLDRREVLGLDRLRRPPRERPDPRRAARQRDALLAARHRRLVGPPLLGEHPPGQPVDLRPAGDTLDIPAGCSIFPKETPAPLPSLGRPALHRHPLLERA